MIDPIEEYKRYLKNPGVNIFPRRVTVELSNECNLRCIMCPRNFYKGSNSFMAVRLYKKIIDEISEYENIVLVPFFRGESLLHPGFTKLIRYAKDKNIGPIQLATNGMFLNEKKAQEIIDLGIDFISFSLDTLGKANYERIRKGARYDIVMRNVEKFIEMRDKEGLKLPEIQVSVVETEATKATLQDFIDKWLPKVDRVRVYMEHSKNGRFGSIEGITDRERRPCLKPLTDIAIYQDGSVALCNHDWDRKEFIGNVMENKISDIWNSEAYKEVRLRHWEKRTQDDPTCKYCDHWASYYANNFIIGKVYRRTGSEYQGIIDD